ncbi:MAG: Flp pilus assembly protein CpaB [Candidatus Omnitrophica bacterium]|nr:Flp pilus assembly protein CpaB [Candidatus Omnitrophota bacterium]
MLQIPKQKIILIAGVVLAIIGIMMVKVYIDQQRQQAVERANEAIQSQQANQASVLVAKQDIPKGVTVPPESLEIAIVPNRFVQPQAVTSLDRIAGMITVAPISKGEQITLSKLTFQRRSGALAELTPVGKRAITISVDAVSSSLLGMLKVGDYTDIIALLPVPVQTPDGKQASQIAVIPLFQNVLVLAVGRETGGSSGKKEEAQEANPPVTVALTPQESSLLAFVQEQGKLRLVLRSPGDSQIEPIAPASWDTLLQYIMPKEKVPVQAEKENKKDKEPAPDEGYVEIYRGSTKGKSTLSH